MKNDEVKITKTNENKSFWINKDFVSEDLKKELTTANIILSQMLGKAMRILHFIEVHNLFVNF